MSAKIIQFQDYAEQAPRRPSLGTARVIAFPVNGRK